VSERDKTTELEEILRKRNELDEIIDTHFKRPTTVLFTDIVGSTSFFSTRGDIEGQLMIQRHNDLLIPLLSKYQGKLIEIIGDAIFGSFDEPSKAVTCAVKMQQTLAQANHGRSEQDHIQVRIGINMGAGYVEGSRVRGIVVNIAERIKSLAGAGQILISESVYQRLQPGRDPLCTFVDKVSVKGIAEEIKVYQVLWRNGGKDEGIRHSALRKGGPAGVDLILEASRENGHIKISVHERREGGERTLRPYETVDVAWEQIERGRHEIITLLNRANRRAKVTREILTSLKKSGQILFDLLIPPKVREKISSTDAENLILYVDDRLVHIPWELLFDGKQFLCRRFAMGRIVSTRQAPTSLSSRIPKAPFKVLVVGDPRGDLDASYQEGIEIKTFLDEKRDIFHVDFKSHPVDVPFVKKNLRDYDIVHYAGHADYHSENPSESAWLLKNGRLRAGEISAMGGLQPMPSLVFSNACQSGHSGEWRVSAEYEQQIFGLANAYLLSGVQHYIGTFWEILDEPSWFFAKRFYSFLAEGLKIGEAVRRARVELIDTYGEETIVWATYMLYGDPTFEFALPDQEPVATPAPREAVQVEWQQVMRGEGSPVVVLGQKKNRVPLVYLLLSVIALSITFAAYKFFYPFEEQGGKETGIPLATVRAPGPKNPEETTASPRDVSPKVTEAPESLGLTQPKEKASAAGAKAGVPAAPIANRQETSRSVPVKEGLAPTKESTPHAVAAPLSLKMNIIGQRKERDGSYTEVVVSEGSVLRSYDNFQVHLETNRPSYVYILIYDSQGKAEQLFPDAKIDQPGFIEAGRQIVIPRSDLWFWLDEHTGTETIYVLASEKPMSDVQRLLMKMQALEGTDKQRVSQEIKERIVGIQRGVGGITKGQAVTYILSDGKKIQKVTEVVTGTGSVVRAISFHHR
jgi:class 3 adenylate cyclase/CHAT domain-containing protein